MTLQHLRAGIAQSATRVKYSLETMRAEHWILNRDKLNRNHTCNADICKVYARWCVILQLEDTMKILQFPLPPLQSSNPFYRSILIFQLLLFHWERCFFYQKDLGSFLSKFRSNKNRGGNRGVSSCMSHALKISRESKRKNACLKSVAPFHKRAHESFDLPRRKGSISRLSLGCIDLSEGEGGRERFRLLTMPSAH